jgi:hypothetical protein
VRLRLLKTDPQPSFRIPRVSLHWPTESESEQKRESESEKSVENNYSKTFDLILKRGRESKENTQIATFIHPKGGIGY